MYANNKIRRFSRLSRRQLRIDDSLPGAEDENKDVDAGRDEAVVGVALVRGPDIGLVR